MWSVVLTRRAEKQVGRLASSVVRRLRDELAGLQANPFAGRKLQGRDAYRWRFGAPGGEWRVLYRIEQELRTVVVFAVTTRENAPY